MSTLTEKLPVAKTYHRNVHICSLRIYEMMHIQGMDGMKMYKKRPACISTIIQEIISQEWVVFCGVLREIKLHEIFPQVYMEYISGPHVQHSPYLYIFSVEIMDIR